MNGAGSIFWPPQSCFSLPPCSSRHSCMQNWPWAQHWASVAAPPASARKIHHSETITDLHQSPKSKNYHGKTEKPNDYEIWKAAASRLGSKTSKVSLLERSSSPAWPSSHCRTREKSRILAVASWRNFHAPNSKFQHRQFLKMVKCHWNMSKQYLIFPAPSLRPFRSGLRKPIGARY